MPEHETRFHVEEVPWSVGGDALYALRYEVFVEEQKCPVEEELDGNDPLCRHVQAIDASGRVVGCGRLSSDGLVGRMAVASSWRGRGVGKEVLCALLRLARQAGMRELKLSSQCYAIPFYGKLGFVAEGDVYLDANIPHRMMRLCLS